MQLLSSLFTGSDPSQSRLTFKIVIADRCPQILKSCDKFDQCEDS